MVLLTATVPSSENIFDVSYPNRHVYAYKCTLCLMEPNENHGIFTVIWYICLLFINIFFLTYFNFNFQKCSYTENPVLIIVSVEMGKKINFAAPLFANGDTRQRTHCLVDH